MKLEADLRNTASKTLMFTGGWGIVQGSPLKNCFKPIIIERAFGIKIKLGSFFPNTKKHDDVLLRKGWKSLMGSEERAGRGI